MKRRIFLKRTALVAGAILVAPAALIACKPKLDGYTVAKPMIGGIKIMSNFNNFSWMNKQEYDFLNEWHKQHECLFLNYSLHIPSLK